MGKTSFQDITGNKYGRLTVLRRYEHRSKKIKWECRCDCGKIAVVTGNNLKNGHTQSCGCYKRDQNLKAHETHGKRHTRIYGIWTGMKTRCYDKNCRSYKNYGGRGIRVCDEWLEENGFESFYQWSILNGYKDNLSIDRINVDMDYSPNNCRWANSEEQANNTSKNRYITVNGATKTSAQWAKATGIKSSTIRYRIDKAGLTPEEAVSLPVFEGNRFKKGT